jgi:hypothetical protein
MSLEQPSWRALPASLQYCFAPHGALAAVTSGMTLPMTEVHYHHMMLVVNRQWYTGAGAQSGRCRHLQTSVRPPPSELLCWYYRAR